MKTLRWLFALCLLCLLFPAILSARANVQAQAVKPDVHLSFDIRSDGSNETRLEVAVHPLLDPLMQRGLALLAPQLERLPGNPRPELGTSKRDGREYSSLSVKLNSLGDLNAFVNTSQMLSGLLGVVAPDVQVPSLLSEFSIDHDFSVEQSPFTVRARMTPETAQVLAFLNLTIHVKLPYMAASNNADQVRGTELSWRVTPGQPMAMAAEAAPPSTGFGRFGRSGSGIGGIAPMWPILIGVLLLIVVAVVMILLLRARRPKEDGSEEF
jgi:hypothetical protein